jgi:hypothetical protein
MGTFLLWFQGDTFNVVQQPEAQLLLVRRPSSFVGGPPRLLMFLAGLPESFQEFIGLPFRFGLGDAAALQRRRFNWDFYFQKKLPGQDSRRSTPQMARDFFCPTDYLL